MKLNYFQKILIFIILLIVDQPGLGFLRLKSPNSRVIRWGKEWKKNNKRFINKFCKKKDKKDDEKRPKVRFWCSQKTILFSGYTRARTSMGRLPYTFISIILSSKYCTKEWPQGLYYAPPPAWYFTVMMVIITVI